jgi:hypothetical protein
MNRVFKGAVKVIMRSSLIDQMMSLFFNDHEFGSLQSYYKFTWSLTSGPVELVEVRAT